jgi:hypothetical protein
MTNGQTTYLPDEYTKEALYKELQNLHKRINDLGINPNVADLKTNYAATDLGTAAAIATALNSTNTALNAVLRKLNLSQ